MTDDADAVGARLEDALLGRRLGVVQVGDLWVNPNSVVAVAHADAAGWSSLYLAGGVILTLALSVDDVLAALTA